MKRLFALQTLSWQNMPAAIFSSIYSGPCPFCLPPCTPKNIALSISWSGRWKQITYLPKTKTNRHQPNETWNRKGRRREGEGSCVPPCGITCHHLPCCLLHAHAPRHATLPHALLHCTRGVSVFALPRWHSKELTSLTEGGEGRLAWRDMISDISGHGTSYRHGSSSVSVNFKPGNKQWQWAWWSVQGGTTSLPPAACLQADHPPPSLHPHVF